MSIPADWAEARLDQIAEVVMGQSPDSRHYNRQETGLPFLQGCAEFSDLYPTPQLYCTDAMKVAQEGSVLFSVRAPVGKMNVADRDYVIGRGLGAIRATEIDQEFLRYFLHSREQHFELLAQGSTFSAISGPALQASTIQFPPDRKVQRKISGVLSIVDKAIAQTKALIAKQQRIKTGLMQDLLTRGIDEHGNLRSEVTHAFKDSPLGQIPVEWEVCEIDSILERKEYGLSSSLCDDPSLVPVLRMNNLIDGEVDMSDLRYASREDTKRYLLEPGDVLFNRTNSLDYVGRTGIYRGSDQVVSFASYLVRLVTKSDSMLPEFLNLWLNLEANHIAVKRFATVGVQQANINPTNLGHVYISYPSTIDEQQGIVCIYTAAVSRLSALRNTLAKIQRQKTALMKDLLTGKVPVTPLLDAENATT